MYDKILHYVEAGKQEGAEVLPGGRPESLADEFSVSFYIQPAVMKG